MITADIDINEWNRTANRIVTRLKLDAPRFVKKEVGELVKTVVRLTPPKNLPVSKQKADRRVAGHFRALPTGAFRGDQTGKGEFRWLFATPAVLVGVRAEDYQIAVDATTARRMMFKPEDRKVSSRLGRRGRQAVSLVGRRILRRQVLNQVRQKIKKNFGRLKAGWLAGVFNGELKLTGGNLPPKWVTNHRNGVRGTRINNLQVPGSPSYTVINRAKGSGSAIVQQVAADALRIRAKAMAANAKLILAGKKGYTY